MVQRVEPADHRAFSVAEADAVPELEEVGLALVLETDLLRGRPDLADVGGRHARLRDLDRLLEPGPGLVVDLLLDLAGSAHIERAVVAGPVAVEALHDVD